MDKPILNFELLKVNIYFLNLFIFIIIQNNNDENKYITLSLCIREYV